MKPTLCYAVSLVFGCILCPMAFVAELEPSALAGATSAHMLAWAGPATDRALPAAEASPDLPSENLVANGDFEQGTTGWPASAFKRPGIALKREAGNTWLAISENTAIAQVIKLNPNWAALRVSARMRVTNVIAGKEGWHDARLAMNFTDAVGKHLDPWPSVFHAQGTGGWCQYGRVFKIPAKATRLDLSPSMFGASGTAEFDAIVVTVARLRTGEVRDLPRPAGADDLTDPQKRLPARLGHARERMSQRALAVSARQPGVGHAAAAGRSRLGMVQGAGHLAAVHGRCPTHPSRRRDR